MPCHQLILILVLSWLRITIVTSLTCSSGLQACGNSYCYDPNTQGCVNGNVTIQCINSCNGTCYSSSQYCYNGNKVCNIGESVCNVTRSTWPNNVPYGLTCYNTSQFVCSNNTMCERYYSCGSQCLETYWAACANNQTICPGYYYYNTNIRTCGNQKQCYDITNSTCMNGTTICPLSHTRLCGSRCWNPSSAQCVNGSVLQCINSCNGTCYSNSQYCYNSNKICNIGEAVCNVTRYSWPNNVPYGLTCYNTSEYVCSNNTMCERYYSCGSQCLETWNAACADNRTICPGFDYYNTFIKTCGIQKQCYDSSNSTCLNGTTVCPNTYTRLCGNNCWNAGISQCINNSVIRCNNSCNGTCYSSSQYCSSNSKICNIGESVCNVTRYSWPNNVPYGLTCYNTSQYVCSNNTMCQTYYSCGSQCLETYWAACANNQTICPGYYYYNTNMRTCGSQKQCYDSSNSTCLNDTTVCSLGGQLCAGSCYNPQSQYCTGGNNTIYCLSNPSSPYCPSSTTSTPTTTTLPSSNTCCSNKNCSTNADCCQSTPSTECQCYRHLQNDTYGSCINPNILPICGDSCPVQSRCRVDSDCCRCQCATITLSDSDGSLIIRKRCVQR